MQPPSHLEPFVLKHLLDGHQLAGVAQLGLVDDAKGAVADDFGVGVADLLRPVGPLARGGHHCRHLAAVFVPWGEGREEAGKLLAPADSFCKVERFERGDRVTSFGGRKTSLTQFLQRRRKLIKSALGGWMCRLTSRDGKLRHDGASQRFQHCQETRWSS